MAATDATPVTLASPGPSGTPSNISEAREASLPGLVAFGPTSGTTALVILPDDTVLGVVPVGRGDPLPNWDAVARARDGGENVVEMNLGGSPARIYTTTWTAISSTGQAETYVVQVAQSQEAELATLAALRAALLASGVVAILVSLFTAYLYTGRALAPIRAALGRQRQFAADASHELRTPLAIVASGLEVLEGSTRPTERRELVADLKGHVGRLGQLVDDLLLLARADSGASLLEPVEQDLAEVGFDLLGGLSRLANAKGSHLELDAEPTPVVADRRRLEQLVVILIDNAIRHSPAGSDVRLSIHPTADAARFEVDDACGGIPEAALPHVFDRFWRGPSAPAGSAGVGLAVAATVVSLHGGSIAVTNHAGGCRFRVIIPRRLPG